MAVDHTDHTIKGMMDAMHQKLKNPGGSKPLGYHERAKPSLNYGEGTPLKIKPVSESHKRLDIHGKPTK